MNRNAGANATTRGLRLSLFAVFVVSSAESSLAEPVDIPRDARFRNIAPYAEYFIDQSAALNIHDVLAGGPEIRFQPHRGEFFQLGLTPRPVWVRISLRNESASRGFVIEVRNPRLSRADLYVPDEEGNYTVSRSGNAVNFEDRQLPHPSPSFRVDLNPGESRVCYLRVQNSGSLRFRLHLWTMGAFLRYVESWTVINFLLIGALLAMGAYNCFIFLGLREAGYLYSALLILLFALYHAAYSGVAVMYLWPNHAWWSDYAGTVIAMCCVSTGVLLCNAVLNAVAPDPRASRIAVTLAIFGGLAALLSLTDFFFKYYVSHTISIVIPGIVLWIAFGAWRRGVPAAGYFILAWGSLVLGSGVVGLLGFGIIPTNLFTEHVMVLSFILSVALWSFSLTERVKVREEDTRRRLENMVDERTRELRDALVHVKTLRGLLPICSECKKIRDDQGYWNNLENYVREHTEADFSHGLCPGCATKLYPELYERSRARREAAEGASGAGVE